MGFLCHSSDIVVFRPVTEAQEAHALSAQATTMSRCVLMDGNPRDSVVQGNPQVLAPSIGFVAWVVGGIRRGPVVGAIVKLHALRIAGPNQTVNIMDPNPSIAFGLHNVRR
jgi:hypothetical protein